MKILLPLFKTTPPFTKPSLFWEKSNPAKILQTQTSPSVETRRGGGGGRVLQLRRDSNLNSIFKFSCLIASIKFQTTMGAFHNLSLVSNYQILYSNVFSLSILWMVYYYNAILLRVKHKGCCCDFRGFWGFNWEMKDLFLHCLLAVLEVCDNETGVEKRIWTWDV